MSGEFISTKEANEGFKDLQNQLSGRQLDLAISGAINHTLLKGRTEARKAVKAEYNIPQKNLSGINYNKSTPITLTGSIYASARPLPMNVFSPKFQSAQRSIRVTKRGQQKVKEYKRKVSNPSLGVSIEVHKGSRVTVPYAFMIPGAQPHVFARGDYKGGGSYGLVLRHKRTESSGSDTPIAPLLSVTVHAAVINPVTIAKIKAILIREYPIEFEHELTVRVQGLINRSKRYD